MSSFLSWPIRRQLLVLVVLAVLPALAIILYSGLDLRRSMLADAEQELTQMLDSLGSAQQNLAVQTRSLFETLSELPAIRARDPRACSALFASLLRRNPQYANLLAADPAGNIFAASSPVMAASSAERRYFRDAVATREFAAGEFALSRSTSRPTIHFAYPAYDDRGSLQAVIIAAFDIRHFSHLVSPERFPRNSVFLVTDRAGILLHDSRDQSRAGRPVADETILAALGGAADSGLFSVRSGDGVGRLFSFRRLRLSPDKAPYLFLAVGIPESEIYAVPDRILARNLILLGAAALCAFAAAWILGNVAIVDRIKALVSVSRRFGQGDLAARTDLPRTNGEIGQLARSFDEMAQSLESRERSQREVEVALRESESRYRNLFQDSPAVMLLIDPETGDIADANRAATRYYGYSRDEFREKHIGDLNTLPPDRLAERLEQARALTGSHFLFTHRLATGEIRPVEVFSGPVSWGGKAYLHAIVHDISVRQQALEALRLSEERYRLVVENASDAIFVAQDGFVKFPNSRATTLTGYTADELTATPFPAFIHPDDREMVVDRYRRRIAGQEVPARYPFRLMTKSGETLWMDLCPVVIAWEGRPATLNFLRDITVQKRLEAQLLHAQKMEAVGTLAGGIAHDFNNLLQAMTGFAALALHGLPEDDVRVRTNVKHILSAADRATALVRRLLAFSRQDGATPQRLTDVNAAVARTVEILERTIPKMIRIETQLAPDLKPVLANPVQIEQVVMNLATNARDAMPDGGRLRIETRNATVDDDDERRPPGAAAGPCVLLGVTDTGVGMDAATKAKMFDPFFTTKDVGAGTGLGLSTIYGIVLGHGGWIHCESEPGRGARFEIFFPAVAEPLAMPGDESVQPTERTSGSGRILFVDDEEMIRNLAQSIFEADGYSVLTAESGEAAVEIFRQTPGRFDLVILDIGMPGMGGRRCLEELRRIAPDVKVLVASGYSEPGLGGNFLDAGACGFVSKPYTPHDILARARAVLADPPGMT